MLVLPPGGSLSIIHGQAQAREAGGKLCSLFYSKNCAFQWQDSSGTADWIAPAAAGFTQLFVYPGGELDLVITNPAGGANLLVTLAVQRDKLEP